MDKRQNILNYAIKRFMGSGYSSVNMDDISRGCGISKATLYSIFPSKEALMFSCIDIIVSEVSTSINSIMEDNSLPYEKKLTMFFVPVAGALSRVNADALDDIKRNVPEAFEKIDRERRKIINSNIGKLIDEGKQCGYILKEVDPKLVTHIIIGVAKHIVDPDVLYDFGQTPNRILESVVNIIIRGCFTEKGLKLIESKVE